MNDLDFQYKMIIAIRTDKNLSKGKMAICAAQAAVLAVEKAKKTKMNWLKAWFKEGQKKVVVQIKVKEELELLLLKVKVMEFPYATIRNSEEVKETFENVTAIAIGPAPNKKIDTLTATLKLL